MATTIHSVTAPHPVAPDDRSIPITHMQLDFTPAPVALGVFPVALTSGERRVVAGLITEDRYFAIGFYDGAMHVFHYASGCRLSTAQGFESLLAAFKFIEYIYPLYTWSKPRPRLSRDDIRTMGEAYTEARHAALEQERTLGAA